MKLLGVAFLLCIQADGLLGEEEIVCEEGQSIGIMPCSDAATMFEWTKTKEDVCSFLGIKDNGDDGKATILELCPKTCEALVSCGKFAAVTCSACGHGASWCNGVDCEWKNEECVSKDESSTTTVEIDVSQPPEPIESIDVDSSDDQPTVIEETEQEPCIWGEWEASSCSVTCDGTGFKVLRREITSGDRNNCNGCNTRVDECTIEEKCPVDCQWSEWSSSECTAPCGSGTLTKERTSKLPKEKLNETPSCMHKLVLVESCNTQECPVNCEWGRWQDQACDCATGLMTRTRQKLKEKAHGGRSCSGKSFDTTACHYLECKIPYAVGQKGEICQEDKKIMDESDCRTAIESIYFDYDYNEHASPSDEAQKGCVVDESKDAFFNAREIGGEEGSGSGSDNFSPICKQDPKLCPEACKDECMNGPRDVPGRRNKHKHNGYCYKWCARTSNKNPKTHNGEVGYCGVSKAIKSDAVDCRGCYKAFH